MAKNNNPPHPADYYQPRKLRFEDADPRGFRAPAAYMAKMRRAWIDKIQGEMEGLIQAAQTYRRALIHRWTAPDIRRRAADRAAWLDELEEKVQNGEEK